MTSLNSSHPNIGGPQSTGANYQIIETSTKGEFKLYINGEPHTLKVGGKVVTDENQLKRLISVFKKTIGDVPVLKEGQVLKLSAKSGIQIQDTNTKSITQLQFKDDTAKAKFASRLNKLVINTAMNTKDPSVEKKHSSGVDTPKEKPKETHTESGRPHASAPELLLEIEADTTPPSRPPPPPPKPNTAPIAQREEVAVPQGEQPSTRPAIPEDAPRPAAQNESGISSLAFIKHLEDSAKADDTQETIPPRPEYDTDDTSSIETPQEDEAPPPPPPDDEFNKEQEIFLKDLEDTPPPPPPERDDEAAEITADVAPEALYEPEGQTEAPAPPPPPPPPPPTGQKPTVGDAKSALFDEITKGKTLKKAEVNAEKKEELTEAEQAITGRRAAMEIEDDDDETEEIDLPTPAAPEKQEEVADTQSSQTIEKAPEGSARSALLDAIRKGKQLKKTAPQAKEPATTESASQSTVNSLSETLDKMRSRIQPTTPKPADDEEVDWS